MTSIGELVSPSRARFEPGKSENRKFVGLEHIEANTGRILAVGDSSSVRSTKTIFHAGDVLYGRLRPYLNKVCVPDFDGICSTDVLVFPHNENINSRYLASVLLSPDFVNFATMNMKGVQHPRVRFGDIQGYPVPLPPLKEQERIVSKFEELITDLEAGARAIKTTEALLTRYKRTVLKSAFEGRLTKEWRESQGDDLGEAEVLLERIGEERVLQSSLVPVDEKHERFGIAELPKGWSWSTIGYITKSMKNGIYKPKSFYGKDGIACLRMYNIEDGRIVWKDIKRMNLTEDEISEYELRPGDILVNRVNSRELVGKAAPIIQLPEVAIFESKNIRLRVFDSIEPRLVTFWLQLFGQSFFNRNAQQTVGMASINQDQLGSMPIPVGPAAEQKRVVEIVESLLSIADNVRNSSARLLESSEKLRRSIMRLGIRGKLVPSDPADEPARFLLQRMTLSGTMGEWAERDADS